MKKDELKAICKKPEIKEGINEKKEDELIEMTHQIDTTPVSPLKIEAETDVRVKAPGIPTRTNYVNLEALDTRCKSFIGEEIYMTADLKRKKKTIVIKNPNVVGESLDSILFPFFKETCPDFEKGPKQESPDFFAEKKEFQFELKAFCGSPGFDISNFTSFIHQISNPGGLVKKLFKTKYLVYEYGIDGDAFVIKNFWMLNIWNLPAYNNKYPISMQVKKKMYYNIRPGTKVSWTDSNKTPNMFLDNLIKCIDQCPHLEDKESLKPLIVSQIEEANLQGYM